MPAEPTMAHMSGFMWMVHSKSKQPTRWPLRLQLINLRLVQASMPDEQACQSHLLEAVVPLLEINVRHDEGLQRLLTLAADVHEGSPGLHHDLGMGDRVPLQADTWNSSEHICR